MAAYGEAVERDGSRADAYARMAVLHDKQGKFRESAELYRKALSGAPGDPDIFCDMGYSFYLQRRWAEAEMNLRQAIALNREHRGPTTTWPCSWSATTAWTMPWRSSARGEATRLRPT